MPTTLDRREFLRQGTAALAAPPPRGRDRHGLVTGHPEGAAAGLAVLASGGNAVDTVVAAALVAGVVQVAGCGIAAYGGHALIAPAGGKVTAIDFNFAAPAAARPGMFLLDAKGAVKGQANTFGWLAAGVPGTLAGLQLALDRHGTRKFAELVRPAIRYAREGFPVPRGLARTLQAIQKCLARDPGSRKLFFRKGRPLAEGDRLHNPELADLLEKLAARGSVDSFYHGDVARQIAAAFAQNGGLVTEKDLSAYRAREVQPLKLQWRGWEVHTAPLTAGGLTIFQTIKILEALNWCQWDRKEFRVSHARVEALRLAWHDRLRWLGDPEHARIPVERLLSDQHARHCADRVRRALKEKKPLSAQTDGRSASGTIHLSAIDAAGTMVALTLTHGGSLGAQVSIDGLGLVLGHGMSRFDPHPGHPNAPGPGKRPLHNMCPTVALRDGKPGLALGARGGRRIPNTVLDVLLARIGEGRTLPQAVRAPRMHTEGGLDVTLEKSWPADTLKRLKEIGFVIKAGPGAVLHAIERDPRSGALTAAAR
jgi:gamma-glutamyltranspeptidase/glutathione hydrolase